MEEIICQLFSARNAAHALHLKTRSFAQHLALADLYEALVELTDELAEVYQGKYGLLNLQAAAPSKFNDVDACQFITELAAWAEDMKKNFNPADTHLLNDWDAIISLIYKTKYKLENLA